MIKAYSSPALRESGWRPEAFQFIYIDGSHKAPDVLEDAVLSFPLLAKGGVMIFDDYPWLSGTPDIPESMPAIGIDAFLSAFRGRLRLLHQGWQVAVTKL
jgi:predicted O-methyltransferase YrrM